VQVQVLFPAPYAARTYDESSLAVPESKSSGDSQLESKSSIFLPENEPRPEVISDGVFLRTFGFERTLSFGLREDCTQFDGVNNLGARLAASSTNESLSRALGSRIKTPRFSLATRWN
jgi:hypothetical protein